MDTYIYVTCLYDVPGIFVQSNVEVEHQENIQDPLASVLVKMVDVMPK